MSENKIYYVFDSFRRYTGSNQSPFFVVPNSGLKTRAFEIESISVPTTFYNINSTNNQIKWEDTAATSLTTTITPGNYTITELCTAIGAGMTNSEVVGDIYTCTVGTNTQLITIGNGAGTFDILWDDSSVPFNVNSPTRNLAKLLGFHNQDIAGFQGDEAGTEDLTGLNIYTGQSVYYINTRGVYLRSKLIHKATNMASRRFTKTLGPTGGTLITDGVNDILKVLPNNVIQGDVIYYRDFFPTVYYVNEGDSITDINFTLEDDNGQELNLNGQSFYVGLHFYLS